MAAAGFGSGVYTWLIFLLVFLLAWSSAAYQVLKRLKAVTGAMRRPYLMAMTVYGVALAWFNVMFAVVLLYALSVFVTMGARYMLPVKAGRVLLWVSKPSRVFGSVEMAHVPFHAAVTGCMLCASFAAVMWYLEDADIAAGGDRVRDKFLRVLASVIVIATVAYAVYGLRCCFDSGSGDAGNPIGPSTSGPIASSKEAAPAPAAPADPVAPAVAPADPVAPEVAPVAPADPVAPAVAPATPTALEVAPVDPVTPAPPPGPAPATVI